MLLCCCCYVRFVYLWTAVVVMSHWTMLKFILDKWSCYCRSNDCYRKSCGDNGFHIELSDSSTQVVYSEPHCIYKGDKSGLNNAPGICLTLESSSHKDLEVISNSNWFQISVQIKSLLSNQFDHQVTKTIVSSSQLQRTYPDILIRQKQFKFSLHLWQTCWILNYFHNKINTLCYLHLVKTQYNWIL